MLTPDLGLFIWNLLAFLILFLILKKFAWKPILKSLKEREDGHRRLAGYGRKGQS